MEIDAPGEFAALKKQYQQELENFLQTTFENFDLPFDRQVMERMLDLSPPGLDEIMALVRAMEFLEQGRYDVFILDSAPTGHLLRLLELPELIDQWLKTFFGLLLKYKLTFRFPDLSQQLVKISRNLKFLRNLWQDPARAALYAVSILTEMAFQETGDLLAACERLGMPVPVLLPQPGHPGLGLSPVHCPESPGDPHKGKIPANLSRSPANRHLSPERTPGPEAPGRIGPGPVPARDYGEPPWGCY